VTFPSLPVNQDLALTLAESMMPITLLIGFAAGGASNNGNVQPFTNALQRLGEIKINVAE
jgi:hypothetical protein